MDLKEGGALSTTGNHNFTRKEGLLRLRITHSVSLDGFALHVQVPDLDREVVPRDHVAAGVGEFHVGDGGDYLGEEEREPTIGRSIHCRSSVAF